ncbi:TPA: major capsid protein [Escherichia coli]|nr:major capsid protein [Escherichia coli]
MLKLKRDFEVQEIKVTDDSYEIAFSSESPVERQILDNYGSPITVNEILVHEGPHNADLTRINNGAALLFNHNFDSHLGVVVPGSVRIDSDRIGRAVVRFSKVGQLANEIKAKVDEGTISKISFGYDINEYEIKDNDLIVSLWSPYEISFVTVPADDKVGLGRLLNTDNKSINVEGQRMDFKNITLEELQKMTREELAEMNVEEIEMLPEELRLKRDEFLEVDAAEKAEKATNEEDADYDKKEGDDAEAKLEEEKAAAIEAELNKEKERVAEIEDISKRYKVAYEKTKSAIDGKTSVSDFKRSIKPNNAPMVVRKMTKDTQIELESKFNLANAMRALSNGKALDGAEAEYTQEMISKRQKAGRSIVSNGLYLPLSVLKGSRAINTVPTVSPIQQVEQRYDSFVKMLLAPTVLGRMGVNFLTGLNTPISIPKQTASSVNAFGFVDENGASPEGESAFTNIQFMPKTFTGGNPITRQALLTMPNLESFISDHIVSHSRAKLEALILGSATDAKAPQSLDAQLTATSMGMTYKEFVKAASVAKGKGVDMDKFKYLMDAGTEGDLKTTLRDAAVAGYIISDDNKLGGHEAVGSGLVKDGTIFAGDFSALTVAEWEGIGLDIDDTTYRSQGAIVPRVWADIDWKVTADDRLFKYVKTGA